MFQWVGCREHSNLILYSAELKECRMQGRTQGGGHGGFAPNGCMKVHLNNNVIVSGKAFRSAENSGKPLGGRGCTSNPSGELTALPRPSSWWG